MLVSLTIVAALVSPIVTSAAPADQKKGERTDVYQVPIGTVIAAELRTPIGSASNLTGDQVDATLTQPVLQDGVELIPRGSVVSGSVIEVVAATRTSPSGRIVIAFTVVQHSTTRSLAAIRSRRLAFEANGTKKAPSNVGVSAGEPIVVTLAEPLIVRIPRTADSR